MGEREGKGRAADQRGSGRSDRGNPALWTWERWADDSIGIDRFGASAPGEIVMEKFGFTAQHVADAARRVVSAVR